MKPDIPAIKDRLLAATPELCDLTLDSDERDPDNFRLRLNTGHFVLLSKERAKALQEFYANVLVDTANLIEGYEELQAENERLREENKMFAISAAAQTLPGYYCVPGQFIKELNADGEKARAEIEKLKAQVKEYEQEYIVEQVRKGNTNQGDDK